MKALPYILCVDDQKEVLDTLSGQLENSRISEQFQFEYSESGAELLEIFAELQKQGEQVAVVVSDQIMPEMYGSEVLKEVHRISPMTNKILLTGESRLESIIDAINQANLYRFIAKPWDKQDLLLTIEEAAKSFVHRFEFDEQNQQMERLYRCSQTLNAENDLEVLIEKTMAVVMEQTQATRGSIVVSSSNGLMQVYSFLYSHSQNADRHPFFTADSNRQFPQTVLDFVITHQQGYICNNTSSQKADEWLSREPYFRHHQPQSIVCEPLNHLGEMIGVLYLEHAYRPHAFGKSSLNFIKYLAPNLAVSIRNVLLYSDLKDKKERLAEQKYVLDQQMSELKFSILATKRIQDAIQPNLSELAKKLKAAGILYRPHSIVSGDFLWFEIDGPHLMFAVGDCTGHGIPGAILSVLAGNLLERIVMTQGVQRPDKILHALDRQVFKSMKQDESKLSEGLDLAFCRFNFETFDLEFAGAQRPLYHIRKGEFNEIRGSKFGIGGHNVFNETKVFELHKMRLQTTDRIFLSSDGLSDQFGGPTHDKKFSARRLRQHLSESHTSTLAQCLKELELYLDSWQGKTPQTDDIIVAGFEF